MTQINKIFKALVLAVAILAAGQSAWAQTQYINQLMLLGDIDELINGEIALYQLQGGWELVDYDLNMWTNSDHLIYLLYKTGTAEDKDNPPITDFYIKSTSDKHDHPDVITYNNRKYYRITNIVGSSGFSDSYGDLNHGAGGKYIFLYYTTDAWDYTRGITEISFNSTADGAVCGNGGTEPQDLNEGTHCDNIYMHFKYVLNAVALTQGTKDGVTAWWGTLFDSYYNYKLGEGAVAYTMGSDYLLYRLGTDGSIIPAGTPVVILAEKATIPLTVTSETFDIQGTNILYGTNILISLDGDGKVPIPGTENKGDPYVLSINDSGVIGFRLYEGSAIPAHKAYYVKTE
ncbi:MAG: hypothetical protein J5639_03500 [Bacteroidales bacterium]|nr:hypothetical protein [Bacteroidales bacterium]